MNTLLTIFPSGVFAHIIENVISDLIAGSILSFWVVGKLKELFTRNHYVIPIIWNIEANDDSIKDSRLTIKNEKKVKKMLESFVDNPSNIEKINIDLKQNFFCNGCKFETTKNTILSKKLSVKASIRYGLKVIFSEVFVRNYISEFQTPITDFAFKYIQYVVNRKQSYKNGNGMSYDIFIDKTNLCVKHNLDFDENIVKEFKACGPDSFLAHKVSDLDTEDIMIKFIFILFNKKEFFIDKEKSEQDKIINKITIPMYWSIGLS